MSKELRLRRRHNATGWDDVAWLVKPTAKDTAAIALLTVAGALVEAAALVLLLRLALEVAEVGEASSIPFVYWTPTAGTILPLIVALSALRLFLFVGSSWLAACAVSRRTMEVRNALHAAYVRSTWRSQMSLERGSFQDLVTTQTARGSSLLTSIFVGLTAVLNLATFTVSAMAVTPLAALFIIVGVAFLYLLLRPVSSLARRVAESHSEAAAQYGAAASESAALHQEVRVFGVEDREIARVAGKANTIARHQRRSILIARSLPATYQSAAIALLACCLYLAGRLTSLEAESAGATMVLLLRAFGHSQKLQTVYNDLNDRSPYLRRVRRELGRLTSSARHFGQKELAEVTDLHLQGVGVHHSDSRPALGGVTLRLSRGEIVGIVGASGAGKTTLLRLLGRFVDADEGNYLVNGLPAHSYEQKSFARQFVTLGQEPRLLHGTVAQNVRFLRDLANDEVERALIAAHIDDEVHELERGAETRIGESGRTLSGGQRQRVAFARALAARPSVVLLDEPTSALDEWSELKVHETIERLRETSLVIVVTHRQRTLELCDRILTISDGHVTEVATRGDMLGATARNWAEL